ncbi:MAG: RcpC/CpaB family pilus assembly protein [Gemmatimonadota bacterium]
MKRRVLTVLLAVLLAVIGTGAVLAYVRQADARALAGQKAVRVLVAQQQIPAGTAAGAAFRDGMLTSEVLPASSVPAEAVGSVGPGLAGLVSSTDIPSGQVLLRPMLVPAAQVTGALAIPAGMVAVTISLCIPEAVAGNLHPGSQVAVFTTAGTAATGGGGLTASAGCSGQHQQQGAAAHSRLVLPSVEVLSTGQATAAAPAGSAAASSTASAQSSSSSAGPGQGGMLVTLAVTQANAARLIQLTVTGLPYLALVK